MLGDNCRFDDRRRPGAGAIQPDPSELASWNDGAAKQAIFDFVRATIDRASPNYVTPEDRITVFDQDGTLWVDDRPLALHGAVRSRNDLAARAIAYLEAISAFE